MMPAMRGPALLAAALACGFAVHAETDPPLSAEAFETFVQGRTFDTHDQTGRYGVETFLPGRRAIWRDAERCLEGRWRPQGALICFDYPGEPQPYCWTYHDRGDWLMAWLDGDRANPPILLYPSPEIVTCEGYFGV
ncbi:hypothetical protein [Rhodobacter calidifons]|uniref:Beta/gamma crystallin n=1 Tax=Rhodobacter calidifons TaxID=2715277 RepID=A0ABX0G6C6_9RHOB|nr:hypothetical protein [Rhodobacter calidifons]NHB76684.1 hypothetical protein [Rhodobacter calidifons]